MAALSDFTPIARPFLPSCLDIVMEQAALRSVARLSRESLCWQEEADGITIVDGAETYSVSVDAGAQVVAGIRAWVDGNEDFPLTDWTFDLDDMELTIPSGVSDGDAVHFLVALEPTVTATSVPDKFLNRHGQTVKHGVIAELAAQPANPWTNFELSQYHETLFVRDVNRVRIENNKSHTTQSLRVKPRLFA